MTQKWQERTDFISKQLRLERKVETAFSEVNDAMIEHHEIFGHQLLHLPQEPVLNNVYDLSNKQHGRELAFIALSMVGIGGVLWYLEN